MEHLLTQTRKQRDQYEVLHNTWKFATDILETLTRSVNSPIGLSMPFSDNHVIMALPVGSGVIDLPKSKSQVALDIKPDPVTVARSMNISLQGPVKITLTMFGAGPHEDSYDICDWGILRETDDHESCIGLLRFDGEEEFDLVSQNIIIPRTICEEIAKQLTPEKLDEDLIKHDLKRPRASFNFEWEVYLVVPPNEYQREVKPRTKKHLY